MSIHKSLHITGRVQGVSFRSSAKIQASVLGLNGRIWNEDDGSVMAEIEGESKKIEQFIAWAKKGPRFANVDKVEETNGNLVGYKSFDDE